ncbi:conjugal transfer protein TraD [Sphingobium indicum IP26]|uniref:Conjugal transfer protein TraD n=1 Tax=Sphingobium indicum F2 TaxID=1450518 RepID=A0A8E0WSF1_9SPHN|nr:MULTISPECIES: conjugal transfer protein TraD [Sphingobium]EPR18034.1 conjugal transfer protein TraD [Sphingobium indicum IP26]EQA97539.1 conjugal transfer protein TraD [Sphingobium sp. HDIP04]KER36580.1 conjugal transfer protein TraD [Sphingobium indicum F2]
MHKPRDFDSELKALADKAKALKERRVRQLGELVTACGADALDADLLAGALLHAVTVKDAATNEGWRKAGAAFFRGEKRQPASGPDRGPSGTLPLEGGGTSA